MRLIKPLWLSAALALTGCATTYEAKWSEKTEVPPAAAAGDEAQALVSEGDELWKSRGDKAKLGEALAAWEKAAEKLSSHELFTKLSRAHYLMGDGHLALAGDAVGRDAEYQKGLDWATKALKLAAPEFAQAMSENKKHAAAIALAPKEAVPSMYWFATNMGKWAASKGFATRLRYKDDIKATMDQVKSLDELFFYAAPWRYFGAFEAVTAGMAGGSLEKSEEFFKKADELAPNYLGTKVLWADYLCTKKQDKEAFKKLLDAVLAADAAADPEIEPENKLEQEKAKKLLAEMEDKF